MTARDALAAMRADVTYSGAPFTEPRVRQEANQKIVRDHAPALVGALGAVLAIHQSSPNSTSALHPVPLCTCGHQYPCATVQAIETALEGR